MSFTTITTSNEIIEAHVVDDWRSCSGAGRRRPSVARKRHAPWYVRPLAVYCVVVLAASIVGTFVGQTLIDQIMGSDASSSSKAGQEQVMTTVSDEEPVSVGKVVVFGNGLKGYVAGTYLRPARTDQGEPLIEVAFEIQNIAKQPLVLKKNEFKAVDNRGREIGAYDQVISRGFGLPSYQFTSTSLQPGETISLVFSFFQRFEPTTVVYDPSASNWKHHEQSVRFDIGEPPDSTEA